MMAPRSKANGGDTDADASMSDAPDHRPGDDMVSLSLARYSERYSDMVILGGR